MAKEITVPLKVNSVNYTQCKTLIENYPEYPCVKKVHFPSITYTVTDFNKNIIL